MHSECNSEMRAAVDRSGNALCACTGPVCTQNAHLVRFATLHIPKKLRAAHEEHMQLRAASAAPSIASASSSLPKLQDRIQMLKLHGRFEEYDQLTQSLQAAREKAEGCAKAVCSPDDEVAQEARQDLLEANEQVAALTKECQKLQRAMGKYFGDLLTPDEVAGILEAHPAVKQHAQEEALRAVREHMSPVDVVSVMTTCGISNAQLQAIRKLLVQSAKAAGFSSSSTPFTPAYLVKGHC